jgi:hypothetical protein
MLGLLIACLAQGQPARPLPIDVTRIETSAPVAVAEIDTGKLKGDVRRFAWSPDGQTFYIQTAEGNPATQTLHHYSVAANGGAIATLREEPDWASAFWSVKQDAVSPGSPSLKIEILQGSEIIKTGTGPAGVLDRSASPDAVASGHPSVENLASGNMGNDKATVVQLALLGEPIATWVNERPLPGARFSWGPSGAGALVYVGDKGQLIFFDRAKHRRTAEGIKDAAFPAWSADGGRVAFLQKTARKKYVITWVPVSW